MMTKQEKLERIRQVIREMLDSGVTVKTNVNPSPRYYVGRIGTGDPALGSFDTIEEVYAFQKTLDQDALANGEFYLDDMTEVDE